MAFDPSSCVFTPAQYNTALPQQIPQIQLGIQEYIRLKDPYTSLLSGGTFPANMGEFVRSIVPSRPVLQQSQIRPAKTPWLANGCAITGPIALPGNIQFQTLPQVTPGESELLCLSETYSKVKSTLDTYVRIMRDGVYELIRNDSRIQMHDLSGFKFVARQNEGLSTMLTGGLNQVAVPYSFNLGLPNANMSWEALLAIMNLIRTEIRQVDYFPGETFGGICSAEQLELLRNSANLRTENLAGITGSFKDVKDAYWLPMWQDYLYRGIRFTVDEQPLRFNAVNEDLTPAFIEPQIQVEAPDNVTYGSQMITNPNWSNALYEVMFLVTRNAFQKQIPDRGYTGDGQAKFRPQFYSGEMQWINNPDMCGNMRGDMGKFIYQYVRAILPMMPHGIVAIAYQRCQSNLNLLGCSNNQS